MAAGFKKATVNASSVPSTQTNFPSYVDLSRLGITTLAEAQSVRVYADSGKTTEWAREIVSATEMHVKVPSLTSTTSMYVDWDGTSSDYAATDTYGRNAVWTGYASVYHMEGNSNDSTSSGNNGTDTSVTYSTSTGKIQQGVNANSATDKISASSTNMPTGTSARTVSGWGYISSGGNDNVLLAMYGTGGSPFGRMFVVGHSTTGPYFYGFGADVTPSSAVSTNTWFHLVCTYNGTTVTLYRNGTSIGSGTPTLNTTTSSAFTILDDNTTWAGTGTIGNTDEVRVATSSLSANWITTEYNNQSAESTFWGTWSDVGGTTNTTNFFIMS